jgi:hypothetical protein
MQRPTAAGINFGILAIVLLAHGLVWWARAPLPHDLLVSGRPWAALLRLLGAIGVPGDIAALCLGGLAGVSVLAVVGDLASRVEGPRTRAGLVAPVLLVLSPSFAHGIFGTPEIALFAAVLLLAMRRTFDETGAIGARSLSILPWAVVGAWCQQGIILLVVAFVHRLLYARRYGLGRPHLAVISAWFGLSAAGAVLLALALGGWSGGPFAAAGDGSAAPASPASPGFPWDAVTHFWAGAQGLALLPFLLFLAVAWKPRPVWYLSTLALLTVAVWLLLAVLRPLPAAAARPALLVPILPLFYVVVGEALRASRTVLEAGGFRGRQSAIVTTGYLCGLALATVWPTLMLLIR